MPMAILPTVRPTRAIISVSYTNASEVTAMLNTINAFDVTVSLGVNPTATTTANTGRATRI